VFGCTIGALASSSLNFNTEGMEFAATALFTVLLIEQWLMVRRLLPFLIAFLASCVSLILFFQHMLLVSIVLSIIAIILLRFINYKKL